MLYLVKLDNAYKIGFTKDEKDLHKICGNYRIKNELFKPCEEVENIFNLYISINLKKEINKLESLFNANISNSKKMVEYLSKLIELDLDDLEMEDGVLVFEELKGLPLTDNEIMDLNSIRVTSYNESIYNEAVKKLRLKYNG